MNKSIDVQIGIFDTEATLTAHNSGDVTIKVPVINWTNNTGSLGFKKIRLKGTRAETAKMVFDGTYLVSNYGCEYPMSFGEFISDYI